MPFPIHPERSSISAMKRLVQRGVRTRFADDLLWLPYVTACYITVTGDRSVPQEIPLIDDQQPHEIYLVLGEQVDANASGPATGQLQASEITV